MTTMKGKPLPKYSRGKGDEAKKVINLRLTVDEYAALKAQATEDCRSVSGQAHWIIKKSVGDK
jgi:hypothetical protein